jgi:hypothetical protein
MNPMRQSALIVLLAVSLMLPMPATNAQGQTVETGIVKLADSNIEYLVEAKENLLCCCQVAP